MKAFLLSLLVSLVSAITRPSTAICPDGYANQGVRPDGQYRCRPRSALPDITIGARDQVIDDPTLDEKELSGRIYCSGGSAPIVVNEKTVGCMRGGWHD